MPTGAKNLKEIVFKYSLILFKAFPLQNIIAFTVWNWCREFVEEILCKSLLDFTSIFSPVQELPRIRFLQGPCSLFQHHFFPPFSLFLSLQLHLVFLLSWWLCYTNGKSKYFLCSLLYPQWLTYRAYQTSKTGSILYFERSNKSKIYIFIFYIQIHFLGYWIYSCFLVSAL